MLIHGDCLEKLKELEDNSVDSIVTDPPYGLSFMGKKWDYDVPSKEVWTECLRVLKPGGYLLSFAGTRTQHRMAVNIEDAGFEIRDMIAWVYGSGFPKSLNIGKAVDKLQGNEREVIGVSDNDRPNSQVKNGRAFDKAFNEGQKHETILETKGNSKWEGWGTALKPALEPITVARKPLSEKTVAENILKWGTGGINIDESRVETEDDLSIHTGNLFAGNSGIDTKQSFKVEGQSLGRFPANLIHDGSDEVVSLFPDTKSVARTKPSNTVSKPNIDFGGGFKSSDNEYTDSGSAARFFANINNKNNGHIHDSTNFVSDTGYSDFCVGGVNPEKSLGKRFFYCAKASKADRDEGLEGFEKQITNDGREKDIDNAFQRGTTLRHNNHPTVKPTKLMQYLVKLVTPKGGVVLDPFMGSGSTGKACKLEGFDFIGIEREEEYIKIAESRIGAVEKPLL